MSSKRPLSEVVGEAFPEGIGTLWLGCSFDSAQLAMCMGRLL